MRSIRTYIDLLSGWLKTASKVEVQHFPIARPAHVGLSMYSRAQSGRRLTSADVTALEASATAAGSIPAFDAAHGEQVSEIIWMALARGCVGRQQGRDDWVMSSTVLFDRLISSQQSAGPLLRATSADNPETWWYHELVLLHALGSYAAFTRDDRAFAAIARAAEFHLNETQPDHATSEPWAIFPFVWHEPAQPLADSVIHAAMTAQPGGLHSTSESLVRDALCCLKRML